MLTARVTRDGDAWQAIMEPALVGKDLNALGEELLARLVAMIELATWLLVQLEQHTDLAEGAENLLQILALYLASEDIT